MTKLYLPAILWLVLGLSESANILTIIPFPSYSHQVPLLSVSKELAIRGHNLTVITTDPPKEAIPNYRVIDTSSAYQRLAEMEQAFGFTLQKEWTPIGMTGMLAPLFADVCDYELGLPQVQDFIRHANETKYDLVLIEDLFYSSFQGLAHRVGMPPVVAIHTFVPWFMTDKFMGVPVNPSYMPEVFSFHTDEMDFFQRVYNTILYYYIWYKTETCIFPEQEKVLRKYFGPDPPSARDMEYNKSLLLIPSDFTVTYPQPFPPNYIPTGPFHIREPKPLPNDLQQWMDGAEGGVVYFSLGSNMQGTSLPQEKRDAFLKAFAKLPKVRFLWKYEADKKLQGLPSNVMYRKWLPQQDVLRHPKLKAFISQCGLQSTEEAIHHAIPILGIPIFGDQPHQMSRLVKEGAAIGMVMKDVTVETVYEALDKLVHDKRYKENAERLSSITKDHMAPALDTAVWWVEYVIRHKGARHLRPASLKLHWFQYFLIDVHAFLILILAILFCFVYFAIKTCTTILSSRKTTKDRKNK